MSEEKYIYTIDPYPQESKEHNKLYLFYDYLKEGRLTTTQCKKCGHLPWPPRTVCPECMSDELEWVDLPTEGTVTNFSVQLAGVPLGFNPPLVFAIVDLGKGVKFLSRLVDAKPEEVKIGSKVKLEVEKVPGDRVLPAFRLV